MSYFDISEDDVASLQGQVAILTGSSSGIGLATVQLFLSKGAFVVGADLQPPAETVDSPNFTFHKTDVTSWSDLCNVFGETHDKHGRIDIVFANAGIGPKGDFLELQSDSSGNLVEPNKVTLEVNIMAVVNQASLAVHYMDRQEPKGGSIVLTASCTGYQRFRYIDYVSAKHAVIGLLRSMRISLEGEGKPIRVNAVAPSWTKSGLVLLPEEEFEVMGLKLQPASAVAKSVGLLVTDKNRQGQCLYSSGGRYVEMEAPIHDAMLQAIGKTGLAEEEERVRVHNRSVELGHWPGRLQK